MPEGVWSAQERMEELRARRAHALMMEVQFVARQPYGGQLGTMPQHLPSPHVPRAPANNLGCQLGPVGRVKDLRRFQPYRPTPLDSGARNHSAAARHQVPSFSETPRLGSIDSTMSPPVLMDALPMSRGSSWLGGLSMSRTTSLEGVEFTEEDAVTAAASGLLSLSPINTPALIENCSLLNSPRTPSSLGPGKDRLAEAEPPASDLPTQTKPSDRPCASPHPPPQ
jgi:hypothetical protein